MKEQWQGFVEGKWCNKIDVRDFIQSNYKEYTGDESFLSGISPKTKNVWDKCLNLLGEELKKVFLI